MKSNLLAISLAVPLAAGGILGVSSSASAAGLFDPLPAFNQLSFTVNFDITSLNLANVGGTLVIPTLGAPGGGPNILFQPKVPGGGPAPVGSVADLPISGNSNSGGFGFTVCNTGGSISTDCTGTIRSFNASGNAADNPAPDFIRILGAGAQLGNLDYTLSLDVPTITDPTGLGSVIKFTDDGLPGGPTAAQCRTNPAQNGCAATVDFFAMGKLTVNTSPNGMDVGKTFDIAYSYAGPRILVDAANSSGNCTNNGSNCKLEFLPTTGAGNGILTVQQVAVPEPSTTAALLGLGVVGFLGASKRKKFD